MLTKKVNPKNSFIKAGVLLAFLVLVYVCIELLSSKEVPARINEIFSGQLAMSRNVSMLSEEQQDSVRKAYAGFYEMDRDPLSDTSRFSWTDRIEINPNGIVWEVRQYRLILPGGDTIRFMHVFNSFLYPWSHRKLATGDVTLSQVRILYQAMHGNGDSCYGASHVDYVVNLSNHGKEGISVLGKRFTRYTGELKDFFPRGATKMVDDIRLNKCVSFQTFHGFALGRVTASLSAAGTSHAVDSVAVAGIVRDFYAPILWHQIVEQYPVEDLVLNTPPLKAQFNVESDGSVRGASIAGAGPAPTKIEEFVLKTIQQWRFPATKNSRRINATYEFKF